MKWWEVSQHKWFRGWKLKLPVRDSQRQKVYDAEQVLVFMSYRIESVDKIQERVDKILYSKWADRRLIRFHVQVKDGRGKRHARGGRCGFGRAIWLPKWSRTEYIILHEVAHAVGDWKVDRHGPRFCAIFLDLVSHVMGHEAGAALKLSFKKHHVRFHPYRNPESARHLSPSSLPAKRQPKE